MHVPLDIFGQHFLMTAFVSSCACNHKTFANVLTVDNWCFSTYARAKMPLLQLKYSLWSSFSINLRLPIPGTRWGRSAITQNYYHSADAIVLVYNIGAAQSFRDLPEWLWEVEEYAGSNITRILVVIQWGGKQMIECSAISSLVSVTRVFYFHSYKLC